MSHSVGQPLQFETCCTFYRSLSQKRFPKNKAVGKGKPEKAGQCWKSIDIQSLVSTCRTHEVNPYTRLVDVMQRIDPSRPRCGAADATTVEGELCRQPVGVRHRKGHPGTRAQIPQPGRQILTPTQGNVPKWPVTQDRQHPGDDKYEIGIRLHVEKGSQSHDRTARGGNRQGLHSGGAAEAHWRVLNHAPTSRGDFDGAPSLGGGEAI